MLHVAVGDFLCEGTAELVKCFHNGLWKKKHAFGTGWDEMSDFFNKFSSSSSEKPALNTSEFTRLLSSVCVTAGTPSSAEVLTLKGIVIWSGLGYPEGNKIALGKRLYKKHKNALGDIPEKTHRIKSTGIEFQFVVKFMETPIEEFLDEKARPDSYDPIVSQNEGSCTNNVDGWFGSTPPTDLERCRVKAARKRKDYTCEPCSMHVYRTAGANSTKDISMHNVALAVPVWVRQALETALVLPTHILLVARNAGLHVIDKAKDEQRDKQLSLSLSWIESSHVHFWGWDSVAGLRHAPGDSGEMDEFAVSFVDGSELVFDCSNGHEISQNMGCFRKHNKHEKFP